MENALKKVVYADTFYQCPTNRAINSKLHENNRMRVLYNAIGELGKAIMDRNLKPVYERISSSYEDAWFPYLHVKEQTIKDDISVIQRFVDYVGDEAVVETGKSLSVETPLSKVFAKVSFITCKNGKYYAYIIRHKKADKSPNGKSLHTNSETDLSCMVAKAALEEAYPNIQIKLVFMSNEQDSLGNIGSFNVCKTKKSNVFIHDFSSYYEDGLFEYEAFLGKIEQVLGTKVEPNCFGCDNKDVCQKVTIKTMSKANAKDEYVAPKEYSMPQFTASQLEVIENTEGALLICAGPGSGKTATVVGRIRNLISKGVSPEFILAITFTKEAANELKERCMSFCKPYEMPEIMTLNALGYQILKLNPEYVGNVRLMSQRDRFTLIDNLLSVFPPLKGFSYSVVKGNNGLLARVDKALKAYSKGEGDYGDDFIAFAKAFDEAVKAHGYITFDEQISLSQKLFDEHPDILDNISARYKYIMVDEFQDIDDMQAKFIYSISKKYFNICAVGDDDQSIYAFRGGTNKYMLHFKKLYPDAKVYTLRENFRSTEKIINAASKQIAGNKRIKKEISPIKKGGIEPIHIAGQTKEELESTVSELVGQGISYEDIAVIASKNATLENLQHEVTFPSVLGREFLVDSPFFKVLRFCLGVAFSEEHERHEFYLRQLVDDDTLCDKLLGISSDMLALGFAENIASILDLSSSAVLASVTKVITDNHIRDCKALFEVLQYMADYGDEIRVIPDVKGSVIFITSHESKGMEWKAVLMIDDYKDEATEEQNRLIYVAMTRAADLLYVFDKPNKRVVAA